MATINSVAKEAGVSYSTVARFISGQSKIDPKTAEKVKEAMRKLDYRPDIYSASDTRNSTNTIGVITTTNLTDWFYAPIYEAIYTAANQMGYAITMCQVNYLYGINKTIDVVKLFDGKVDGVIFVGEDSRINNEDIRLLIEKKYPVVTMFGNTNVPGVIRMDTNNYDMAYQATDYLVKLGHTKIAHVMGNKFSIHAMERLNGYVKALEDNNIPESPGLIKFGNFAFDETYQCSLELIDNNDFTAVICGNDVMAWAFIRAAKERDLKIPQDISVIGFDDIVYDNPIKLDGPLITTFRQPRRDMSITATKALVDSINGKDVQKEFIFNCPFVERNSTAPRR